MAARTAGPRRAASVVAACTVVAMLVTPADAKKGPSAEVKAYCSVLTEPLVSYAPCHGQESIYTVDDSADDVASYTSIAIGADGTPVVSYHDATAGSLKVLKCKDLACSGKRTITTVDDPENFVGLYTSIAIGTDGNPVISYYDDTTDGLKVAKCNDPACTGGGEIITTVDDHPTEAVGIDTSIAIGTDGNPVISHYDDDVNALRVTKCNDPACAPAGETHTAIDVSTSFVGFRSSLAVGVDGQPVISYWDNTAAALKVAKCNDPACASGGETITTVDDPTVNQVGLFTSIAIGTDGNPVVAYADNTDATLKVAKCNDPACDDGVNGLETITTVDDPSGNVGYYTSIAIGFDGNPVVSYTDISAAALRVAKCNDPACAGGNETISVVDDHPTDSLGFHTSIAIGVDGNPVISYKDETADALKVARISH